MKIKGQVTIFIVLGIVIAVGVLISFLFFAKSEIFTPVNLSPKEYIQKCVEDTLNPSIKTLSENGGRIQPLQFITYYNETYNYLCYQGDNYQGCYNTHPMLEFIIENEITQDTKDSVERCFTKMENEFEDRGHSVSFDSVSYSVDLLPGELKILLESKVQMTSGESSSNYNDFGFSIVSQLYELVKIAREIINQESQYCNFEYNGFMLLYPQYDIKRIDYSDSKIYQLYDRPTNHRFKFAVRSCAFPPGI